MRSLEEIQAEIIAVKERQLPELNSSSGTALWRLWVYVVAVAHYTLEGLWEVFRAEVNEVVASRRLGTPAWYTEIAKEFQLGDALQENGTYALLDESKRIINQAAFKEVDGLLTLKVAKSVNGELQALEAVELGQFRAYMNALKFAGTRLNVISLNADELRGTVRVLYDGVFNPETVRLSVQGAIVDYLNALPFAGLVMRNELLEVVRGVDGVEDCEFTVLAALQGVNASPIGLQYETQAGYILLAEDFNFIMEVYAV